MLIYITKPANTATPEQSPTPNSDAHLRSPDLITGARNTALVGNGSERFPMAACGPALCAQLPLYAQLVAL